MSVRFIFPNHPYVGYSLRDVDWIAEHLAEGWHISAQHTWVDGEPVVELVKIYNSEGVWHWFHYPESQWLILTEDGVPFDFFASQLDMEMAAKELAYFRSGTLVTNLINTL